MSGERLKPGVQQTEKRHLLKPGTTQQKTSTADQVMSFTDAERTNEDGQKAQKCRILIGTNEGREAFNVDPVTGGLGYPRPGADEFMLDNPQEISNWRIINDTAAETVTITYTMFYRAAP